MIRDTIQARHRHDFRLSVERLEARILLDAALFEFCEPDSPMLFAADDDASITSASDAILDSPPAGLRPYGATGYDTSEFMIGDVHVTVVLTESDGSIDAETEDWSTAEIANVKSEIQEGLDWWVDTFNAQGVAHELDFIVDWTYADTPLEVGYEPIERPSGSDYLWIDAFLQAQGHATGGSRNATRGEFRDYLDGVRMASNTDWAFGVFVADSSNDSDNRFTDSYFAYAWIGGPYTQMTYGNNGWGISKMGQVLAHEMGHIFYALDEYPGSSDYDDHSGYYNTQNLNAYDGNPAPGDRVDSLMGEAPLQNAAYAAHTSSPSSLEMIGWKDTDGDGLFDVLDLPLTLTGSGSYDSETGTYSFTGTSTVQALPNQNPNGYGHDITINEVELIQYRIDDGSWTDGNTYGSYSTAVSQDVAVVDSGAHTIEFRTVCVETGVTSGVWSDSFVRALDASLDPLSETGISDNDGVTSDNTPTFIVTLFDSGTLEADWDGDGNWDDTYSIPAAGDYDYTAPAAMADGDYATAFRFTDSSSDVATIEVDITIDTAAPDAPVGPDLQSISDTGISTADNITSDDTPSFDIASTDVYFRMYKDAVLASGPWETGASWTAASLPDGSSSWTLTAVDTAGNESDASGALFIELDTVAPEAPDTPDLQAESDSGVSSTDNITNTSSPVFDVSGFGIHYRLYRDDLLVSPSFGTAATWTDATLTDGPHSYRLHSVDAAGNVSVASETLTLTVDTLAPDTPVAPGLRPAYDKGVSSSDGITNMDILGFDIDQTGTYFRFYREGTRMSGDYEPNSSYMTDAQPEGIWDYSVACLDVAGNMSAASPSTVVTIDRTAPETPDPLDLSDASDTGLHDSDNLTNDPTPTLIATGFGSYYRIERDGNPIGEHYESHAEFTVSTMVDGTYDFVVFAVDAAGNVSTGSAVLSVAIDTDAPGAPDAPDLQTASDSGYDSADNLTNVTSPVLDLTGFGSYYRLTRDAVAIGASYESAPTFTDGPLPEGAFDYVLYAVDAAGNVSEPSNTLTITVDLTPALPPAPILSTASDTGMSSSDNITSDNTPTIIVSNAEPYFRFYADGVLVSSLWETGGSWTTTALSNGVHGFDYYLVDEAGNQSSISPTLLVAVDTVAPPAPDAPDLRANSDTGIDDEDDLTSDSTPTLVFNGYGTYWRLERDGVHLGSDYSSGSLWTETGLLDGTYSYRLMAMDVAGNVSAPSEALVVTVDTEAPPTPAPPALQSASDTGPSGSDGITADNTPTFDIAVVAGYYRITRNGAAASGAYENSTTWTDTLVTDGHYEYAALAVDAAGNASGASYVTLVTIDTEAPYVPGAPDLRPQSDTGVSDADDVTADDTPTFSIITTDILWRVYCDGVLVSGAWGAAGIFTSDSLSDGTYAFTTTSVDAAGNESAGSDQLTVAIDSTAPPVPDAPDLQSYSDTGVSNSDDLTSDATPTLLLSGYGSYYRLERDGVTISPAYATGDTWQEVHLSDGEYVYALHAVDAAGNTSTASDALDITIDTAAPPQPAIPDLRASNDTGISDSDNITNISQPTFDIAHGGTYFRAYANGNLVGGLWQTGTTWAPLLADETAEYTVTTIDTAGNESPPSQPLSVTIDTAAPARPNAPDLRSAQDTGVSDSDDITAINSPTLDLMGFGTHYRLLCDGALLSAAYATDTTWATGLLLDRTYTYDLVAVDVAGNASSAATLALTVDTTLPDMPNVLDLQSDSDTGVSNSDNLTSEASPSFTVDSTDSYFRVLRNGLLQGGAYASGTEWTAPAQPDGTWNYTVHAVDAAGNVSTAAPSLQVTVDTVAPGVPDAPDLRNEDDTGQSDFDGVTSVSTFRLDLAGYGTYYRLERNAVMVSDPYATDASWTAMGLADGTYDYVLYAVDPAGNTSAPSAVLPIRVDTVGPQAVLLTPATESDNPVGLLQVEFNDAGPLWSSTAADIANYMLLSSGGDRSFADGNETDLSPMLDVMAYSTASKTTSIWLSGQLLDEAYTLIVSGSASIRDIAGNLLNGGVDQQLDFTVDTMGPAITADLQAASDSGVSSSDNVTNIAQPTWRITINEPGILAVDWDWNGTNDKEIACPAVGTYSLSPDVTLTDGDWNVTMHFTDSALNLASDTDPTVIDTTAPAVPPAPDLLSSSDTGSSNTDNVTSITSPSMLIGAGADYFRLYRNGVLISTEFSAGTIFTANSQTEGTWAYTTRSVDTAGNVSGASASLDVTIDTTCPIVTTINTAVAVAQDAGTAGIAGIGDIVRITWDGSGDQAAATVRADLTSLGGPPAAIMFDDGTHGDATPADGIWSRDWTVTSGTVDAPARTAIITVTDLAGNVAWSVSGSGVAVDSAAPTVNETVITTELVVNGRAFAVAETNDVLRVTFDASSDPDAMNWVIADLHAFGGSVECPLFDDATHGDATANDGVWTADFTVRPGELQSNGVSVTVLAADDAGNQTVGHDDAVFSIDNAPEFAVTAGGSTVMVYDVSGVVDVSPGNVDVRFRKDGSVTRIVLRGSQAMGGLGIVVTDAPSAGNIVDKRSGPNGSVAFVAIEGDLKQLKLRGPLSGYDLAGLTFDGFDVPASVQDDQDPSDLTAAYIGGAAQKIQTYGVLSGNVVLAGADAAGRSLVKLDARSGMTGDLISFGDVTQVRISGNAAGRIDIGGEIRKLQVDGNLTGAVSSGAGLRVIKINGDLTGQLDIADELRTVSVKGSSLDALIQVDGMLKNLKVGGNLFDTTVRANELRRIRVKGTIAEDGEDSEADELRAATGRYAVKDASWSGWIGPGDTPEHSFNGLRAWVG